MFNVQRSMFNVQRSMFNVQRSMFNVLILSHAVVVARLGEHSAGNLTRLAVLDGDSLDGGRCAQGECLTVQGALQP